ncbi:MAG: hypothetical protein LBT88_02845 [Oscillospiraceae bacterium]|jgi:hypothetical protein|nr:hypothetical protein [Oscillospiraceae bacterium]
MIRLHTHSKEHDGARIVSVTAPFRTTEPDKAVSRLEAELAAASKRLESAGAIIGHLKAFLEPSGGAVTLSATGGAATVSGQFEFTLGITFIVYNAPDETVQREIASVAAAALQEETEIELCEHDHNEHNEH